MTFPEFPPLPNQNNELGVIEVHFAGLSDNPLPPQLNYPLYRWIQEVVSLHQGTLVNLQIIFCSDSYLHKMNVEYLDHDTLTDIITFPYSDPPNVHGDLYISTDRVADNASKFGVSFLEELHRVIIHGVLHLLGNGDKTPEEALKMRELESEALSLIFSDGD